MKRRGVFVKVFRGAKNSFPVFVNFVPFCQQPTRSRQATVSTARAAVKMEQENPPQPPRPESEDAANTPSSASSVISDSPIGKENEKEPDAGSTPLPETTPLNSSDLLTPQHVASTSIVGIDFGSSSSVVASSVVGSSKLPGLVQNRISSVGTP